MSRQPGHYPAMHDTACELVHDHLSPACCTAACWCHIPPIHVLAVCTDGTVVHEPHERCKVAGWHSRLACLAFLGPDGQLAPRHCIHPRTGGKAYKLAEIDPKPPRREAA